MVRIKFNYNSNSGRSSMTLSSELVSLWTDALQITIQETSSRMRSLIESEISECKGDTLVSCVEYRMMREIREEIIKLRSMLE